VTLGPYRRVLAVPGLARLLLVATLARVPTTAAGIVLTLHVVEHIDRGYGAAGAATAAVTVGMAIGGPWRGRAVDRLGVRRALLPSIVVEGGFWAVAPTLGYATLLPGAVLVGLFALPAFGLTRQVIGAMVPEELRRPAFSLDSITVEISFMLGPLVGVLVATQLSTSVALVAVGGAQVLAGLALVVLNPPVAEQGTSSTRLPRRSWFSSRFVAALLLMGASTIALAGTDVSALATLRDQGRTELVGLVFAVWAFGSILGGAVHGALPRAASSVTLVLALGLLTMPLGLVDAWWALALLLLPAGALCAPSVTATVGDVARLVPSPARGEAMGWHSTAATVGVSIGAPLAGFAIDRAGPGAGFVVTGGAGVGLALVALVLVRYGGRRAAVGAEEGAGRSRAGELGLPAAAPLGLPAAAPLGLPSAAPLPREPALDG